MTLERIGNTKDRGAEPDDKPLGLGMQPGEVMSPADQVPDGTTAVSDARCDLRGL